MIGGEVIAYLALPKPEECAPKGQSLPHTASGNSLMESVKLSDRQLAGQRLMIGFDGTHLNRDLQSLIDRINIGGIILFSRNLNEPDQIANLCNSIQDYARKCGQPPLFIAVDQEGGEVARLKEPFTQFPGNPYIHDEEDAIHFATVTASELSQVGINMNMAPVLDVAPKDVDSIMSGRVFGSDPKWVSRLGVKIIDHLQQNNIIAVAKHFPGIGRTTLDSHQDMPILDAGISEIEGYDLIPFREGIHHGVSGVMLSHILYQKLDPEWPASLSSRIANELLRERMMFDGIVLTDDLDMGAIVKKFEITTVIQRILQAEIDIVLICHSGPNIEIAHEEILKNLTDSPKIKAKGIESFERIMRLKEKYLEVSIPIYS